MEKAEVWGKRIECLIGLFILIPPLLSVVAFTISIFSNGYAGEFATMKCLSSEWTAFIRVPIEEGPSIDQTNGIKGSAAAMSAAPFYLGIMALVGAYLIKDSFRYFFMRTKKDKKSES